MTGAGADQAASGGMTLALVIPVWNDAEGLARLLAQVAELRVFSQIIVADDASDEAQMAALAEGLDLGGELINLRSAVQGGAGHARNRGLDRVTASHVIFFDSDDLFTPEFRDLVADLQASPEVQAADFTIFRHVDSRVRAKGGYGPLDSDQAYWGQAIGAEAARAETAPPVPLSRKGATRLCRIAAYPWNKIYRTGFLREQGIRCTEIPVHNDLELHWASFIRARTVYCSARVACEHFVHPEGTRLTNRTGDERLRVFEAFSNLHDTLDAMPDRLDFLEPYAEFMVRLAGWIIGTLEPQFHADFHRRSRRFLLGRLSSAQFALIASQNPGLANRIVHSLRNIGG